MAIPTLPHPNMDFTPLDILTAAEMDKMVANDQYLRDFCAGLANGTNIENGVIQLSKLKSDNLNWHNPSYENGFSAYNSGGYQTPQYAKDAFRVVHLRGLVKHSQGAITEQAMFTLPAGFRPAAAEIFATPNAATIGRVNINPDGRVLLSSAYNPNSGFVSLSGISFQAA